MKFTVSLLLSIALASPVHPAHVKQNAATVEMGDQVIEPETMGATIDSEQVPEGLNEFDIQIVDEMSDLPDLAISPKRQPPPPLLVSDSDVPQLGAEMDICYIDGLQPGGVYVKKDDGSVVPLDQVPEMKDVVEKEFGEEIKKVQEKAAAAAQETASAVYPQETAAAANRQETAIIAAQRGEAGQLCWAITKCVGLGCLCMGQTINLAVVIADSCAQCARACKGENSYNSPYYNNDQYGQYRGRSVNARGAGRSTNAQVPGNDNIAPQAVDSTTAPLPDEVGIAPEDSIISRQAANVQSPRPARVERE